MPANVQSLSKRFARNENGTIGIIFALSLTPVLALVGMSIDYGPIALERRHYQAALDATVSATEFRRELLDAELYDFARVQLNANLDATRKTQLEAFALARDADGVHSSVAAAVETPFWSILGKPRVKIEVTSTIGY